MAASTNYNQNPSSSTSPPTSWDVFLSFRGLDTRNTFTSHLYKDLCRNGIKTFMDDRELRSGEVISDSLPQAIQESKAFIVVLSENYASSSWCLDELVEILRCYRTMKRLVIPVFYYIDPSVVRHQKGSFKEAFEKHQTRYDVDKLSNWRLTLNEVADFSGCHISKNRSQADIVDEVVERVLLEINPVTLNVAKYPVGLHSRVKDVTTLFNSDVEAVIKIGIHGMGGVGKTTLAKAVYNQNYQRFQGSCFLANVREVSGMRNGLVSLQQKLIADVLKRNNINVGNVDQGIELIRARICSRKVLIVIDDLDDPKPLEYLQGSFAWGSMVIITTRNEDLLDRIKVKAKYKVNQMDKEESRQLFTQHAFGKDTIPHAFTELSKEILKNAGGLPLALQVFGSTLLNESEDGWTWFIEKLKRAPIDDVEENLMISFDALKSVDPNLQDIFLDIACFYIGWKKEEVAKILETCYTFVNRKIDILQKRCLITTSDKDILGMHDLLRDMGRKIARNNSPDEPGKHSRLWAWEDTYTVLKNHKGTESIQGIISRYHYSVFPMNRETFAAESFKRMSKLKILYLNNVNLTGSFTQTFEDLRWLRWTFSPLECLPSEFYAEKLVILELPHSNMRTIWELSVAPQVFEKLRTLNMGGSKKLETTPDFIRLPCLETLNLEDCSSLEEVHASIGILVNLVHLNLRDCKNLRSLPDSICSLRALEVLIITGCSRLEALPAELGSTESLKTLEASELSVSKLPDSIGSLSNLVKLDLSNNEDLETLPDRICNLRLLEILDISECQKLKELPDKLGMITCLRELRLMKDTMLRMVPDISQLPNIKDLDLNGCSNLLSISELPPNLKLIDAKDCCSLNGLPDVSSLKHLKKLDLTKCKVLKEIPGLEELTSLKDLRLINCRSLERLPNLCNLKEIVDLNLSGCCNLLSISELPPNLKWIYADDCFSLRILPDLSNLKHLKSLHLKNCEDLKEIQGLEEVTSLEDLFLVDCGSLERLPNLCNLKEIIDLNLSGCGNLLSISELPPNLEWIDAHYCCSLKILPDLSSLKHLKKLDLTNCEALKEIQGLEEVTSLKDLFLYNCWSLERLPNLRNLKHLEVFVLTNCVALKEIQGLEEVTSLKDLRLVNCRSLERLPNLCNLKEIIDLDLSDCCDLLSISELPPNLKFIYAEDCCSLKRLRDLSSLKHLKSLHLKNCEPLKEIQGLEEVTSLEDLRLINCRSLERLPNLCNLKEIICLNLSGCCNMLSISELPTNLERIDAEDCCSLRLPNLSSLKHLKTLDLTNCEALKEIQGLDEVTSLEDLSIDNCRSLESLPNLSNLKQLKKLNLRGCSNLTEIQGLEDLTSLRVLDMGGFNSSLLERTLTMHFFEIMSGFGHKVEISIERNEFQAWITQPSKVGLVQLQLRPNEAHNFLAIILAFEDIHHGVKYSVKNVKSGFTFTWRDTFLTSDVSYSIVIVPSSILSIRDGDDKIEITTDKDIICGIHLLYKTEHNIKGRWWRRKWSGFSYTLWDSSTVLRRLRQ